MSNVLSVTFVGELEGDTNNFYGITPFASSEIYRVKIVEFERLTYGEDVKKVYRVSLDLSGVNYTFNPGDTIGVLPSNPLFEVEQLLERLNLLSLADKPCQLVFTTNKPPLKHLPCKSTLRRIFTHNVSIVTPPKKRFFSALLPFIENPHEKAHLENLLKCNQFGEFLSGEGGTLRGVLAHYASCAPPLALLLEHLPPLKPRAYSISSSPLRTDHLEITFGVVQGGLCTSFIQRLLNCPSPHLPFYFRQPTSFSLPLKQNLILIGTGTGMAPFRGFLQHCALMPHGENGEVWLFYGCRYKSGDFLYGAEIDDYVKRGVLSRVDVAFSREGAAKRYVQDELRRNGEVFVEWIVDREAAVFVCGGPKRMVADVKTAMLDNLIKYCDMSYINADFYLEEMESDGRFLIDRWI